MFNNIDCMRVCELILRLGCCRISLLSSWCYGICLSFVFLLLDIDDFDGRSKEQRRSGRTDTDQDEWRNNKLNGWTGRNLFIWRVLHFAKGFFPFGSPTSVPFGQHLKLYARSDPSLLRPDVSGLLHSFIHYLSPVWFRSDSLRVSAMAQLLFQLFSTHKYKMISLQLFLKTCV